MGYLDNLGFLDICERGDYCVCKHVIKSYKQITGEMT